MLDRVKVVIVEEKSGRNIDARITFKVKVKLLYQP